MSNPRGPGGDRGIGGDFELGGGIPSLVGVHGRDGRIRPPHPSGPEDVFGGIRPDPSVGPGGDDGYGDGDEKASSGSGGGDGYGDGRGIRPYPTVGPGDGNGMGGGFGRGGGSGRPDPSGGSGGGDGLGDGDEKYSDLGDERKLLLDNLSENINEDNLKEHFGKYGEIEDVFVSIDPFTQKCGGFGSITFRSKAIVETVMASSPHLLDGSKIVVSRDQEDRNVTGPDGGNVVEDHYAPHKRPWRRGRGRGRGSRGGSDSGRGVHRGRGYREATQ
ncbi:uncharacterized protein LOC144864736 [Branchiostoma floridae x Branchiostoma japonicum]